VSLRTPMKKVLGRGSAGEGVGHWWVQRVTAVALIPLTAWFGVSLLSQSLQSFESTRAWLAQPWVAILGIVLVLTLAWHSKLGIEVIVEDYVHGKVAKTTLLLLSTFVHVLAAAAGSFAILLLALK
jgi:succinate dehydrogenase / fumarate reductase membrane anchor subunit